MTHLEVVEVFRNSGDEVVLQVVKKIRDKNNQSNGPTISPLVLTALVVVVAIFGYVKYRHRS
uniref:Synaptojanin 2-binding protein n=1 Tax=Callorhinchus milii TaxID=7868 RepID=V9LDX0_CALMI